MALSKILASDTMKLDTISKFVGNHKFEILAGSAVVGALWAFHNWRQSKLLPPGPKGVPIYGSSHILEGHVGKGMVAMQKEYGDIFCLDMGGGRYWVILGTYDLVKEVFVDRSTEFGDRPASFHSQLVNFCDEIVTIPFCELQQKNRKFYTQCLKTAGMSKNSLDSRLQNEWEVLDGVLQGINGPFDPTMHVKRALTNIFLGMLFDRQLPHDDQRIDDYCHMLDDFYATFGVEAVNPFLPTWLARFVIKDYTKQEQEAIRQCERITKFCTDIIEEHERTFDATQLRDFVDICLKHDVLAKKGPRHLAHVCMSFMIDAVGTVTVMMIWVLTYLVHYPDHQRRMREEMANVGHALTLDDRKNTPFTEAFVNEVFRIITPAAVNVGNSPFKTTKLRGYVIPKNYTVMSNLYGIHHDERNFKDPDTFNPERFIADGKIKRFNEFIPFNTGRRKCMGELLVLSEIYYFTATIVSKYEVCPAAADKMPPLEPPPGFMILNHPLEIVLKKVENQQ